MINYCFFKQHTLFQKNFKYNLIIKDTTNRYSKFLIDLYFIKKEYALLLLAKFRWHSTIHFARQEYYAF